MTRGQRWRRRRDLALALVANRGASNRFLADVFDLNPSSVSRILARLRAEFGADGLTSEVLAASMRAVRNSPAPSPRTGSGVGPSRKVSAPGASLSLPARRPVRPAPSIDAPTATISDPEP